jgi:hypothetical protein
MSERAAIVTASERRTFLTSCCGRKAAPAAVVSPTAAAPAPRLWSPANHEALPWPRWPTMRTEPNKRTGRAPTFGNGLGCL